MRQCDPPYAQPLLFQPVERLTPFSFSRVLDEVRATWFPDLKDDVEVRIGHYGPLAAVWRHRMGNRRHLVVFHPILNHAQTPIEVVRFIAKHELTHIELGRPGHPPEFWAREYEVGPERYAVWPWIFRNLRRSLRDDANGLRVIRTWRKHMPPVFAPYTPNLPFDVVPWAVLCPQGGAQLRFDPDWAPRPLPLNPNLSPA